MKTHGLLIDFKYCTGCHACEIACRNEQGIDAKEWGIKVFEFGPTKLKGKWAWDYLPMPTDLCNLCEDRRVEGKKPACVHHCLADCMTVVPVEELSARMREAGDKVVSFIP